MLDPRTVAATYVRVALAAAQARGVDAALVLQGTGVDAAALALPNERLSVAVARHIWERAVALTGDPLLGLKAGQEMKLATFRILGLAAMSCASLADAVGVMLRYQRLVSESGTLAAQHQADGAIVLVHTEQSRVPLIAQQVEAVLAAVHQQARWLSGRDLLPLEVAFRHSPLGALEDYQNCFGVPPAFGQESNRLAFRAADLQAPLPYADAQMCRMHCEMADRQLAALPRVGFVASFAVQWVSARASGNARIGELACALGMSMRSLQRALKDEGQSWTAVVDQARREQLEALLHQGLTLAEAAQRLGYHDASSISRAARRWFGTSAGRWLGSQAEGPPIERRRRDRKE
jgi:AraC-like DNA-binding protein